MPALFIGGPRSVASNSVALIAASTRFVSQGSGIVCDEPPLPSPSRLRRAFAVAAMLASTLAAAQDAPTEFRVIPLSAGIHVIRAEVAADPNERERGLMFRKALGPNQGMVFLFDRPAAQCMWMRNTLIPLSVAFIDERGRIINIEEMAAQTDDNHCAARPATYALEMSRGWFAKHGIAAGAQISGLPKPTP